VTVPVLVISTHDYLLSPGVYFIPLMRLC